MPEAPLQVSIVVGGRFHACQLARELSHRGLLHRLVIAYPKGKTAAFGIPRERIEPLRWAYFGERLVRRVAPQFAGHFNSAIGTAAARRFGSPDIVHGWAGYCLSSLREAKRRGIACVVERSSAHFLTQVALLREEHERVGLPWIQTDPRSHPDVEEYELADAICVPSLFAMRTFLERGFDRERLVYAPLGADLAHFSPGEKLDRKFRVVYAGALTIQKGVHHLLSAFRSARIPNSELRLVGAAERGETELVMRGDMSGVVHVPHVPEHELVSHYRQASVFVLPSVHDGFGMVLAQALASGVPIVGTQTTGAEDLLRMSGEPLAFRDGIQEYPAGYVIPIRSPEALARVLTALAQDPTLLDAKRHAARSLRVAGLAWHDYGERVVAGYQAMKRVSGAARLAG